MIYIRLSVAQSNAVIKVKPEWAKYLWKGNLYMKLLKALYGLKQSAKLWFNLIDESLRSMGFIANPKEVCQYNKMINGH